MFGKQDLADLHYVMKGTRKNCFRLKTRDTTAKQKQLTMVGVVCVLVIGYLFLKKGRIPFFQPEIIFVSFLHFMILI